MDNMLGSSVRFAVSQRLSCPPNKAWRESISTLRLKGIQGTILSGGLLIHPDLFAQTYFQLFCLRYVLLSCTEMPPFAIQCSARVQHKTANFPAP
jgi:hypothetical protein